MNSIFAESATIGIVISLLAYEFGVLLKNKFKFGIFNPLMIAIVLTIVFLVVFNVDYDTYNSSAKYLNYLLKEESMADSWLHLYRRPGKRVQRPGHVSLIQADS